jgi:hypothetical protein
MQVDFVNPTATPEPGTIGLLIIGLTIICTRLGHMRARRETVLATVSGSQDSTRRS